MEMNIYFVLWTIVVSVLGVGVSSYFIGVRHGISKAVDYLEEEGLILFVDSEKNQ